MLIIVLIIIDIISLVIYYNPDFSSIFKSQAKNDKQVIETGNEKCSDGTAYSSCSKDKPMYCYNGTLIKKSSLCSCPVGYKQDFQSCVEI